MTIPEIYQAMYWGKKCNNAKVSLHILDGIRYLCIHKHRFDTFEAALNYLREDGRNIVAPVELEAVS